MTRIVSVEHALSKRGYPADLDGAVVLTVDDPLCEHNAGSFRLAIRDGAAASSASTSPARGRHRHPLGHLRRSDDPQDAVALELLNDASAEDLDTVSRAFGGRRLWMADLF